MQNEKIAFNSPFMLAKLPKSSPVLLAFSGGADSSALLHLLANDAKINGYPLFAAHFNHKIRGEEALRDLEFCRTKAKEYAIPFFEGEADVPALAKDHGASLEAEAREQRYSFFARIMRENGIPILVTAHHAGDLVESVMLHLLRGSGISGLCGIAPSRPFDDGFTLVRPLLECEKEDILDYCKENGIEFVTDSTNLDTSYQRNAVRAHITPKMRELQPKLSSVIGRMCSNLKSADDFLEQSALEYIENECSDGGIPLSSFNQIHPAKKARILSLCFAKKSKKMLEYTHIDALISLCERATPHSRLSLPDGIRAQIKDKKLIFVSDTCEEKCENFEIPFFEGKASLFDGEITISVEKCVRSDEAFKKCDKKELIIPIKSDNINNTLFFRNRRQGDVIHLCGMSKKVKKLLCDKKIPLDLRDKIPVLCSDKEILWIPLACECDSLKKDKIKVGEEFFRIKTEFQNL